jgi:arylsulfatase A-like enzyme
LFDLQTDPDEMTNMAADRAQNGDLITSMSRKLDAAVNAEIGVDDGRELPNIPRVTWTIDRIS